MTPTDGTRTIVEACGYRYAVTGCTLRRLLPPALYLAPGADGLLALFHVLRRLDDDTALVAPFPAGLPGPAHLDVVVWSMQAGAPLG